MTEKENKLHDIMLKIEERSKFISGWISKAEDALFHARNNLDYFQKDILLVDEND